MAPKPRESRCGVPNAPILYPAVTVVGALATLGIMTQMDPLAIAGGSVVIIDGVGWYVLFVQRHNES